MDCIYDFQICALETNSRNASIWEIDFSRSNESSQLELHFMERARERLRQLDSVPEFQDQLSFVSIVGARGVGKSTIASLLSGNSTMFKVASQYISIDIAYLIYVCRLAVPPLEPLQLEQTSQLQFHQRIGQK